jgi:hypothetical protein
VKALLALLLLGLMTARGEAERLRALGAKLTVREDRVVEITVDTAAFTPDDYSLLGRCTDLRKLSVNGKTLTDQTLPLLAGLSALEELSTNQSALSDDGYRHFAALTNLHTLSLWHPSFGSTNFTGAGLAHLAALPRLRKLTFAGSTAGDEALRAVGTLTGLREFSTWHTAQTQAGNEHLTRLPHLIRLKIGQRLPKWGRDSAPSLDAASLPVLARCPALETLELFEIRLRAEELRPLAGHSVLKKVVLHTTDLPDDQADAARAALAGVAFDFKPSTAEEIEATLVRKLRLPARSAAAATAQ